MLYVHLGYIYLNIINKTSIVLYALFALSEKLNFTLIIILLSETYCFEHIQSYITIHNSRGACNTFAWPQRLGPFPEFKLKYICLPNKSN